MRRWTRSIAALSLVLVGAPAGAATIPFTEEFASNVSGWENNANNPLAWVASGGPDGGSYASTSFDYFGFVAPFPGAGPITFRAQDEDNASGNAFVGNYVAESVLWASVWVRHDAPVALTFGLRVSTTSNFPGAFIDSASGTVAPNTWTQVIFNLDPNSGFCTAETFVPGATCTSANSLATVAHLQIGTDAPQFLIDNDLGGVTIDIDKVSISSTAVPEPGVLALAGTGLLGLGLLGRRRS